MSKINIKREAFSKSLLGKVFIGIEGIILSSLLLFIIASIFYLVTGKSLDDLVHKVFSEFYDGWLEYAILVVILMGTYLCFLNSLFFWRIFPINRNGKRKILNQMYEEVTYFKKMSKDHPTYLQEQIQKYKDALNTPCPYEKEARKIQAKIDRIKNEY